MITPTLNTDGFTGQILIEPNRPINWQDNIQFIKYVCIASFIISLIALLKGFFLVMPFLGLEVIFVFVCLYQVYRHYSICQIIYFTEDAIIIESGNKCADKRIEFQRYWSKFHINNGGHYSIPSLQILSKGKSTEIGKFLGYSDKLILIDLVKKLTSNFSRRV